MRHNGFQLLLRKLGLDYILIEDYATPHNIKQALTQNNVPADVDVYKIDIDSADCWVLQESLKVVNPKVIFLEVNLFLPPPVKYATMYTKRYAYSDIRNKKPCGLFGESLLIPSDSTDRLLFITVYFHSPQPHISSAGFQRCNVCAQRLHAVVQGTENG